MANFYSQIDSNKRKSALVIAGFVAFVGISAYFISLALGYDLSFVGLTLVYAGIGSLISYYFSDSMILTLSSAKPANRRDHFDFYTVTENLSHVAQIPMPKLYVIEDTAMNAFATGRDPYHAVVCATTGILNRLDRTELEGVIAHELSHIKNYDIRLMSLVTILVGFVTLLGDWMFRYSWLGRRRESNSGQFGAIAMILGLVLAFLSPLIAKLIQLAISRRREFLADASGVSLTKYPEGLARALEKIYQDTEPLEAANKATAHLYISNPLSNRHDSISWLANLFNTHPPVSQRVAALRRF